MDRPNSVTGPAPAVDKPRPDAELIAAWRRGEEAAAAELVRRHTPAVARFLAGAGAGEDLDDLIQEAFFRAFRRIKSFRGDASFRTWVMAIGSNALKDLQRVRKRRVVLSIEGHDIRDESADPHGEAVGRDLEARLADAVQGLTRLQRDVFLLRAQQGVGYEEIAAAVGTSAGAARVHYHHAVKRLREELGT